MNEPCVKDALVSSNQKNSGTKGRAVGRAMVQDKGQGEQQFEGQGSGNAYGPSAALECWAETAERNEAI